MVVKRLRLKNKTMRKGLVKKTRTIKKNSKKLLIKARTASKPKIKITLQDFIPPIFIKLFQLMHGYINKKYIQVTYVELGITIVFVGTILALAISYFVVPFKVADAAQAFYLYKNNKLDSYVTSEALTKANYGKALLHNYQNGVVLGVQDGAKDQKKKTQRLLNQRIDIKAYGNESVFLHSNKTIDAGNYYSYSWRF